MTLVDETTPGLLAGLLPLLSAELARLRPPPPAPGGPAAGTTANRTILGLPDAGKAAVIAALRQTTPQPIIVVTPRPERARALLDEVRAWLPPPPAAPSAATPNPAAGVFAFPAREGLPYEQRRDNAEAVADRLRALAALAAGEGPLIVTDVQALAQRTLSPGLMPPGLRRGERLVAAEFLATLDAAGYRREPVVDGPGAIARRGGIIDVFPPTDDLPLRIELFGDEIESLRRYDPVSQRSLATLDHAALHPATEASLDAHAADLASALAAKLAPTQPAISALLSSETDVPHLRDDLDRVAAGSAPKNRAFWAPFLAPAALWEHLPPDTLWLWDEADDARRHAKELDDLAERTRRALEERASVPPGLPLPHIETPALFRGAGARRPRIDLQRFTIEESAPDARRTGFAPIDAFGGRLRVLFQALQSWQRAGQRIVIVSLQAPRLSDLLGQEGVFAQPAAAVAAPPPPGGLTLVRGSLASGWRLPSADGDLVLLSDTEIFGFAKQRRVRGRPRRRHESFLEELEPGDYVVHIEHGIARFGGISRERIGDREREYLELRFAEDDRLLVPTDQLHRLQRYVGPSDSPPSLTRLGTQQWQRAKQKVRKAVRELAEDLLQLYAARQVLPGIASNHDTPWQMELEASFPFIETPDQTAAARDVKTDMERDRPMDRLVVGDVGYGKTEVAVRAAFKAVGGGHQVAMLVPTTVLAQQHAATFAERMAAFPVRIEMLSRFRSHAEQRAILAGLAAGRVDIVIGTHRLLQADVAFKSLGLVIIDEEQRFGVGHKERLKQLRREVDVLTLSATPIPRTLHMAMSGIRDMSTIETPPEERLPITTYVMENDDQVVREAILRELERGGQAYFVHNRVRSIEGVQRWLRDLVPEARFLVGHGQMGEGQLEKVMTRFVAGDADVLVCTTIIESGLDIPNVNTIIIHQAQQLGLAQMYQLRGRVGRGAAQAYAYLLYDRSRPLSETAGKRLQTIFDATELGAGFQIALRDLEIRGTGNLLGAEQSGQIGTVGFELYTQLLSETVEQLRAKAEDRPPRLARRGPQVSVDLPLAAHIPPAYIEHLNTRLAAYQQIAAIETTEQVAAVREDLADRFGPLPRPLETLLRVVRLRTLAARLGATSLHRDGDRVVLQLAEGLTFDETARRLPLPDGAQVGRAQLRLDTRLVPGDWLEALDEALLRLARARAEPRAGPVAAPAGA